MELKRFLYIWPTGLYYKTLRIRNLHKMDTFCIKLVSFYMKVAFTGLDKQNSLLQNLYITNPYSFIVQA